MSQRAASRRIRSRRRRIARGGSSLDVRMMRRAIELAEAAAVQGEVPVGAVVYRGEEILGEAANDREATGDPTGHAEIVALRRASARGDGWRMSGCSMAVTLEPCAMCAGALVNARLERLVYGADDPKAGACRSLYEIPRDTRLNHRMQVVHGVDAARCRKLLRRFFRRRRAERAAAVRDSAAPRVVCFDLGGVLVRICASWHEGCAAAGIKPRAFDDSSGARLERERLGRAHQSGAMGDDAFFAALARSLGNGWTRTHTRRVHEAWILGEFEGVAGLLNELNRAGVATACLSNTNDVHWKQMERELPVLSLLHHRHASHLIGSTKPEPDIYAAFERAVGCRAESVIFFDDLPENVAAARERGWDAHQIDPTRHTVDQICGVLRSRRILGPAALPRDCCRT